ncbi:MAG: hypothetical protein FWG64_01020 [Firmicutes bacterium]|nr:hypothetical protein [Bacillota bacterium]
MSLKEKFAGFLVDISTGEKTTEEWAAEVTKAAEIEEEKYVAETGYTSGGGEIRFIISPKKSSLIDITCDLFFVDEKQKYHKISVNREINAANFTRDSVKQIRSEGVVKIRVYPTAN